MVQSEIGIGSSNGLKCDRPLPYRTFSLNSGLYMEFQALQLIVLAAFGAVD